jgi:hypothetical protein
MANLFEELAFLNRPPLPSPVRGNTSPGAQTFADKPVRKPAAKVREFASAKSDGSAPRFSDENMGSSSRPSSPALRSSVAQENAGNGSAVWDIERGLSLPPGSESAIIEPRSALTGTVVMNVDNPTWAAHPQEEHAARETSPPIISPTPVEPSDEPSSLPSRQRASPSTLAPWHSASQCGLAHPRPTRIPVPMIQFAERASSDTGRQTPCPVLAVDLAPPSPIHVAEPAESCYTDDQSSAVEPGYLKPHQRSPTSISDFEEVMRAYEEDDRSILYPVQLPWCAMDPAPAETPLVSLPAQHHALALPAAEEMLLEDGDAWLSDGDLPVHAALPARLVHDTDTNYATAAGDPDSEAPEMELYADEGDSAYGLGPPTTFPAESPPLSTHMHPDAYLDYVETTMAGDLPCTWDEPEELDCDAGEHATTWSGMPVVHTADHDPLSAPLSAVSSAPLPSSYSSYRSHSPGVTELGRRRLSEGRALLLGISARTQTPPPATPVTSSRVEDAFAGQMSMKDHWRPVKL